MRDFATDHFAAASIWVRFVLPQFRLDICHPLPELFLI
jgi:hypothetical protein